MEKSRKVKSKKSRMTCKCSYKNCRCKKCNTKKIKGGHIRGDLRRALEYSRLAALPATQSRAHTNNPRMARWSHNAQIYLAEKQRQQRQREMLERSNRRLRPLTHRPPHTYRTRRRNSLLPTIGENQRFKPFHEHIVDRHHRYRPHSHR